MEKIEEVVSNIMGSPQHGGAESYELRLKEMESTLSELLQSIREGAQMLVESRARDARLSRELCAALAAYIGWLDIDLELKPEAIPQFNDAGQVSLNPHGHLVVVDGRGRVSSRPLEEYPTEVVLTVFWNALSQLPSEIQKYVRRLGERIDLLDRISRELKGLPGLETLSEPS